MSTIKKGYYLHAYGRDCFMESNAQRRTKALALEFLNKIQAHLNRTFAIDEKALEYTRNAMQPATMEVKTIQAGAYKGLQYIDICGENFSFGCDPCENPFEKCLIFTL